MESISNNTIVHKDQMETINEKLNTLQTAAHPLELENLSHIHVTCSNIKSPVCINIIHIIKMVITVSKRA